jgi:hypothetical protein
MDVRSRNRSIPLIPESRCQMGAVNLILNYSVWWRQHQSTAEQEDTGRFLRQPALTSIAAGRRLASPSDCLRMRVRMPGSLVDRLAYAFQGTCGITSLRPSLKRCMWCLRTVASAPHP